MQLEWVVEATSQRLSLRHPIPPSRLLPGVSATLLHTGTLVAVSPSSGVPCEYTAVLNTSRQG